MKALSVCFDDSKINLRFSSKNSALINEIETLKKGKFNLSSRILLGKNQPKIRAENINYLFETEFNRLIANHFPLVKNFTLFANLSITKEENEKREFKIYITCSYHEEQDEYLKNEVAKKLGIALEYIGME